jgi:2-phosphosulfolactate phosphatase
VRIDVVPTVELAAGAALAGKTVLVVDVLRASTTIIAALGNGCAGILPVGDPAEARRRAEGLGALVAGERRGQPIAGFDLGNSPLEFTGERVGGRRVVLTTSNGTRALLEARRAVAVGVAAFVNLTAATAWAAAGGRDVVVLCAGERGAVSLEDHVCAGLLVERFEREAGAAVAPAGARAADAARRYGKDIMRLAADAPWARHLAGLGRGADVAACLTLDTTTLVPVLQPHDGTVVAGAR